LSGQLYSLPFGKQAGFDRLPQKNSPANAAGSKSTAKANKPRVAARLVVDHYHFDFLGLLPGWA
jgi:hypothetical protein